MKTVKTNESTMKTCKSHEGLMKMGNMGNTHGTKLPGGGAARGSKKGGKRRKGY